MTPKSLSIDGGRYISTRQAAELTGYTSDYIGQLARKDKFTSVIIGKARLVDKEELLNYVQENGSDKKKKHTAKARKQQIEQKQKIAERKQVVQVRKQEKQKNEIVEQKESIKHEQNDVRRAEASSFRYTHTQHAASAAEFGPTQPRVLILTAMIAVYTLSFGIFYSLGSSSPFVAVLQNAAPANVSVVRKYVEQLYCSALSLLEPFGISGCIQEHVRIAEKQTTKSEGLVVVPKVGSAETAAETIEKVQKSFSDEIRVIPNEDGKSGVIQPVFRDSSDQEYLYIFVPVEE